MSFKTWVQILMGLVGFVIWTYSAYMDLDLPDDYLQFVKGIVIGIAALALRDMAPNTSNAGPTKAVPEIVINQAGEKQQ